MHEASIVSALLKEVEKELAASGVRERVKRLSVVVGRLSGAYPEALRFAFEVLSSGTPAEGAELVIETPMARCRCLQCNAEEEVEDIFCVCSACGSANVTVTGSRDLLLSSIEVGDRREAK